MNKKEYEELTQIVNGSTTSINTPDDTGLYPIHRALMLENHSRRSDFFESLLNRGADVNVRTTETGYTPLHIAVINNDVSAVVVLLSKQAICNLPDRNGLTPAELAAVSDLVRMTSLLESRSQDEKKESCLKKMSSRPDAAKKSALCTIL